MTERVYSQSGDRIELRLPVEVRRYVPPGDQTSTPLLAFWVDVTVRWSESPLRPERSLSLKTLRLAVNQGLPR